MHKVFEPSEMYISLADYAVYFLHLPLAPRR